MVNKSLVISLSHSGKNFILFLLEVIEENSAVNINIMILFSYEFQPRTDGAKAKLVVKY
jgi:hypothetical protein